LASRRLTRIISQIIFFSLFIQQVVFDGGGHFCNSSGSLVFGLYGMKETRDYFEFRAVPFSDVGQG
jgi:hypothetical protein